MKKFLKQSIFLVIKIDLFFFRFVLQVKTFFSFVISIKENLKPKRKTIKRKVILRWANNAFSNSQSSSHTFFFLNFFRVSFSFQKSKN